MFTVQAYQTLQYVVPRGGIFLDKWQGSLTGSSDGKMNVQSTCALNTQYISPVNYILYEHITQNKFKCLWAQNENGSTQDQAQDICTINLQHCTLSYQASVTNKVTYTAAIPK
jgi:hypothetical protein